MLVFSANSRFSTILNPILLKSQAFGRAQPSSCGFQPQRIPIRVSFAENGIDPDPRAQEMMLEQYRAQRVPWPIGSMYGIYANIGGILMVNVTIYSSTMDPMGGRFHRLASLGCI